jgi:hypothetical protein
MDGRNSTRAKEKERAVEWYLDRREIWGTVEIGAAVLSTQAVRKSRWQVHLQAMCRPCGKLCGRSGGRLWMRG